MIGFFQRCSHDPSSNCAVMMCSHAPPPGHAACAATARARSTPPPQRRPTSRARTGDRAYMHKWYQSEPISICTSGIGVIEVPDQVSSFEGTWRENGYTWSIIWCMHCSMHETCLAYEWYQYLAYDCTNHHATICFMHETYVSRICFMHETYVLCICYKHKWNLFHIFHVLWCTCAYIWPDLCWMHWSIYIYGYMWSNICFMHCSMYETCLAYEWYHYLAYNCTNHHATICSIHETYVSMFHAWNICFTHIMKAHIKASTHETYVGYIIWHIFHDLWYKALHLWLYVIKHMFHALKHIHIWLYVIQHMFHGRRRTFSAETRQGSGAGSNLGQTAAKKWSNSGHRVLKLIMNNTNINNKIKW